MQFYASGTTGTPSFIMNLIDSACWLCVSVVYNSTIVFVLLTVT